MVIIGLLLSLIVIAAGDAQNRANERATQSLIQKLETGVNDRLDALLQNTPGPNFAHAYMAAVYNRNAITLQNTQGMIPSTPLQAKASLRAQVIATYDYVKSQLPDVFFIDPTFVQNPSSYAGPYPFNFAGAPYAIAGTTALANAYPNLPALIAHAQVILPLGNSLDNNPPAGSWGDGNIADPSGTGIFGASYTAAAGVYKNLGYQPIGYDGVDNDGNGLIDDWLEGVGGNAQVQTLVTQHLLNHTHVTARSEMLYAILVEGAGPLGSVFSRDEFTDKEVQDTDGDGLPEFVDAWGTPLQFFRWPIFYHSDFQHGQVIVPDPTVGGQWDLLFPYASLWDQRERDALDPNQQLTAPAWWSNLANANTNSPFGNFPGWATQTSTALGGQNCTGSGGVQGFEYFFHRLREPMQTPPASGQGVGWDIGLSMRRAFYTKFLILSAGQDKVPGVFLYSDAALQGFGANASLALIASENGAMPFGLDVLGAAAGFAGTPTVQTLHFGPVSSNDPANPTSYDLRQSGGDDITNHSLQAGGAIGGTGS